MRLLNSLSAAALLCALGWAGSASATALTNAEVGDLHGSSAVSYNSLSGVYTVTVTGGTDLGFRAFEYAPITGDFSVSVEVTTAPGDQYDSLAGLMARSSTGSPSYQGSVYFENMAGTTTDAFDSNLTDTPCAGANCPTGNVSVPDALPVYEKLTRNADTLTLAYSLNGSAWSTLATETLPMPATMDVGLASADNNAGTATFTYSNLTGMPSPAVPEPRATLLIALALLGAGLIRRRAAYPAAA